ncbi:MAG: ATP-binding protein [Candidatus Omnitrophica bacterium]|nr:ATP-binding protein [Candidatus Omnitrophota bacterium]
MENDSIEGSVFFGREKTCALLKKRLEAFQKGYRQNIGIVGQPFIGKSVLVHEFLKQVPPSEILLVPISCREFDTFEHFSERWMGEFLVSLHRVFCPTLPVIFSDIVRALKRPLPKTLRQMRVAKTLRVKHRHDQAFQELLRLAYVVYEESGKKVLILLDEFDHLDKLGLNDPFGTLGKEMMVQKETMFLVTSSRQNRSASIFQEKLALLFGNFEMIHLRSFDFQESRKFVESQSLGLDEQHIRFLIRLTDGHPYYLDCILGRLQGEIKKHENISRALVRAIALELFDQRGMLYQQFKSILYQLPKNRPWPLCVNVLATISLGHKKLSQVIRFLHQKGNDVKKSIERLLEVDLVQKHGSLFHITDPLFRFWLAKVFYREHHLVQRTHSASFAGFCEDVEQTIQESALEDERELSKRIEELFRKFNNDLVLLNSRKLKCPHFVEVLSKPNNGRVFPVYARNGQVRWLCQVLASLVTEEDVRTFVSDLKRLKGPVQKRFIVGLQGIDLNAKLLAQEAKIQYLDLRDLNFLLDLYEKPKVIV